MINSRLYPVVEREDIGKTNVYRRVIYYNDYYDDSVPYIKDVNDFMDREKPEKPDRFLVVSSSEPVAVKAAKYICDRCHAGTGFTESADDMEFDFDFDEEDYTKDPSSIELLDLSVLDGPDIMPANTYLNNLLNEADGDNAMYEGLNDDENIRHKIDAILADEREKKFIWILPERLREPWAAELQMKKGFMPVVIQDVSDAYYEEVFDMIMTTAGVSLENGLTTAAAVNRIRKIRGNDFAEEDLDWMIQHAMKEAFRRGSRELSAGDFALNDAVSEDPEDKLSRMPGLSNVKEMVTEFTSMLLETGRNRRLRDMHSNMIFYGNPGTGKTTCAQLLADIMAQKGVSSASFIMASRADIIGKYVGHTAVKVSDLFSKARGGVLFVDEAGFFLNESSGGFIKEAVKEFIRFMELYPDVTVIFAMYEKEAAEFMKLDEGLASRISRMVAFEDFSDRELRDIFVHMTEEKGYSVSKGAADIANDYIKEQKNKRNFGNAREVRKLVESVIISHSVRIHTDKKIKGTASMDRITDEDVKKGIKRLCKVPESRKKFGFEYAQGTVMHQFGA
ncbi:MAG: AAA family ATPase [Lachnospiraceae bacterium]|nr:AAA family ATPase [Lachnospiraceae bacterium]